MPYNPSKKYLITLCGNSEEPISFYAEVAGSTPGWVLLEDLASQDLLLHLLARRLVEHFGYGLGLQHLGVDPGTRWLPPDRSFSQQHNP